ncbi:MAG TPA: diguanylate cyclase [Candidatus Aminicenantes bacterium]|nr:diguanylate cyclase [Candidatus Aminicenantes bacterium]
MSIEQTPHLILAADDSPTMRLLLEDILKKAGFRVILAEDGLMAAEMAFLHHPDLIISDIEMPKMDGYQVSRLLKNDPVLVHTPVIILTSKDSSGSVFWGYQTGADLYLIKDFQPEELTGAIEELLLKYRDRRRILRSAPPETVDAFQILGKLNGFLDSQLFETTIINEINRVSVSMTSLADSLGQLLPIMDKTIESHLVGFAVFSGEQEISLCIHAARPVSPRTLELFQFATLQDLATLVNTDISDYKIEVELLGVPGCDSAGSPDNGELPPHSLYSIPIRAKEENLGVFDVYHPQLDRLPAASKQLLGKVAGHLSATIHAARMYDKIKSLSIIDGLTQLYNRRHIMEVYKQEFGKAVRYKSDLSLLMLDLDNFKKINDSHGHLTGDLVLKAVAVTLKASIRNIDLPGRYGGEEFLLILPETAKDSARVVAERVREQIQGYPFKTMAGDPLTITVSIGLCCVSDLENPGNELELVKIADSRLYQAKRTGKNRVISS